jgi:hypothetical protein
MVPMCHVRSGDEEGNEDFKKVGKSEGKTHRPVDRLKYIQLVLSRLFFSAGLLYATIVDAALKCVICLSISFNKEEDTTRR